MKAIDPQLACALLFAALALVTVAIGQRNQNLYFTIAAGAFALATYVTYPPTWALELAKRIPGKRDDDNRK